MAPIIQPSFDSRLSLPAVLFEKVVGGDNFTKSDSYLALWGAYCDYLRRRVDGEGGEGGEGVTRDSDKIEDLRKVFKRARESLSTCKFDFFLSIFR